MKNSPKSPKKMTLPVSDPTRRLPNLQISKEDAAAAGAALFKGSTMTKRGAYAALSYMTCAVLLIMFNKAALSSYNFPSANVITLLQMVCSNCILYAMKRWKVISFTVGESWTMSDSVALVPLATLLHALPLSVTYLLYMLASMESVRGVNVPMYTTLRRTTVVFTMIVEYLLTGQKYTYSVIGSLAMFDLFLGGKTKDSISVAVIVFGAVMAGARDLSFDAYGYAIVIIANITTAIYLATIARVGKTSGLNSFGLMWCNGLICAPVLLLWTFFSGDLKLMINFPYLSSPGFQVVMLLSCVLAFFLNYSIFLNTTLNSAVTQTICGNLKDFVTVGLGWILFGGLSFDLLNILGQGLGFVGSGLYAYLKLRGK